MWVLLVWTAGTGTLLLPLLLGTFILWRRTRRSERIVGADWLGLLDDLRRQLGVRRPVLLMRSNQASIPAVCGILRPTIILPADANVWSDGRRRVVLLHELAHIRRSDCLTALLARLAHVIYWFNPLVWLAGRMLRIEREQACDDLVLSTGQRASDYAQHLLEVVQSLHSARCPSLAAVAMARKSQFEGRLLAILDPRRNRRAMTRLSVLVAAIVLVAVTVPLAVMRAATKPPAAEETPLVFTAPAPATQAADLTTGPAKPEATATAPAQSERAGGATLAVCTIPTWPDTPGATYVDPDEAAQRAELMAQLAAEGPRTPPDADALHRSGQPERQYWWARLSGPQAPPPGAVVADYQGQPCILLHADWPSAIAPWADVPMRLSIIQAQVEQATEGRPVVKVVFNERGRQAVAHLRVRTGQSVAIAVGAAAVDILPVDRLADDGVTIDANLTQAQAQTLAQGLLVSMPAANEFNEAIRGGKTQEVRDLLNANPTLLTAVSEWPTGQLPLHTAANAGQLEIARLLIQRGTDINATDKRGRTPLHAAIGSDERCVPMVRLLLDSGADIKAQTQEGMTPLHEAGMGGNRSVATMLLDAGAEVNAIGGANVTPLDLVVVVRATSPGMTDKLTDVEALLRQRGGIPGIFGAAAAGDLERMREVLRTDPKAHSTVGVNHFVPLHVAAMAGQVQSVRLLLDAGAAVDAPGPGTPLLLAAGSGHLEVVKLLVERGADVNAADDHGGTAVAAAAQGGHQEIVRYLSGRGAALASEADGNALIVAAQAGKIDTVRMLLDKGMDVDARNKQGRTALMEVAHASAYPPAKDGLVETARLLLDRGADVNARMDDRQTALTLACFAPFPSHPISAGLVRALVEHGANVNPVDESPFGMPLHNAAKVNNVEVVKLLLDAGADVLAEDSPMLGHTALEIAEQNKATEAAEVLREATEARLAPLRQQVSDVVQRLLEAAQRGDTLAVVALVAPTREFPRATWEAWAKEQHDALAASPGRALVLGDTDYRAGWAAAGVSDAQGRPGWQTVITLMQYPDGTFKPVRFSSVEPNYSERPLQSLIQQARMTMSSFRRARFYEAGQVGEARPRGSFGSGLRDDAGSAEVTAAGQVLRIVFRHKRPQLDETLEVAPERVLKWSAGREELWIGQSTSITGKNGLVLQAGDGKVTLTRGDRTVVLKADHGQVELTGSDANLTAAKLVVTLPTLEAVRAEDGTLIGASSQPH